MSETLFKSQQAFGGDGWNPAKETWTYASASTFTVSGDVTTKYRIGTKLKFTQTTVKYAVVLSSSYGAPNTTVTILVNTNYTIANAAISANYYSYETAPQGYPDWYTLAAPTFSTTYYDDGAGGQPTTTDCRIRIEGRMVTVHYRGNGTKAGTDPYIVITAAGWPTPANSSTNVTCLGAAGLKVNNTDYVGYFAYSTNPYIVIIQQNMTDNWVVGFVTFMGSYEI